MKKYFSILVCMLTLPAMADILPLDDALRATYTACVGIDDALADMKKMAGINTAVTAVGTATGAGATVVGIVKTGKDKKAEELEKILQEIEEMQGTATPLTEEEFEIFLSEFNATYETAVKNQDSVQEELEKTVAQSKKLGDWRTGLTAASAATNVAGAVIAGTNRVDGDLNAQILACRAAVDALRRSVTQARISGQDVTEANNIISACGEYDYADLSKINTRATGAMASSIVGAATGVIGTGLSAGANSAQVRDDNTASGKSKEKGMNTAANVMSGLTTAASVTATVFNATQIKAIKQVAEIAEKCTGVLK